MPANRNSGCAFACPVLRGGTTADVLSSSVAHEDNLTYHASLSQELVRLSGLGERESLRNEWLDLVLLEEIQQRNQVVSKPCWFQPLEPLDAVRDHSFAAGE